MLGQLPNSRFATQQQIQDFHVNDQPLSRLFFVEQSGVYADVFERDLHVPSRSLAVYKRGRVMAHVMFVTLGVTSMCNAVLGRMY